MYLLDRRISRGRVADCFVLLNQLGDRFPFIWILFDDLFKTFDCQTVLFGILVELTQIVVCVDIIRLLLNHCQIVFFCASSVAHVGVN